MKKVTNLEAVNSRRNKLYEMIRQFKTKCFMCNYNKAITALEFHHINQNTKSFTVANMAMRGKAWNVICEELEKCVVLCSNCHREYHEGLLDISILSPIFIPDEIKFKERKLCPVCNIYFKGINKYCSNSCREEDRTNTGKVDWSKVDLLEMSKTMSNVAIGVELGVSDSYISRRLKKLKGSLAESG